MVCPVRKHFFSALLSGLFAISHKSYLKQTTAAYLQIPENKKLHFHILLRNCCIQSHGLDYRIDIGLVAEEQVNEDLRSVTYTYLVEDVGDLTGRYGYEEIDAGTYSFIFTQPLEPGKPADFIVQHGNDTILAVEHGTVTGKNIY